VVELLQTFRFVVTLTLSGRGAASQLLGNGAFAECSGLELEADIKEYLEGGFNDGVVRRVGRVKLQPIILKRGMFVPEHDSYVERSFWAWLTASVNGQLPVMRCEGHIRVSDPAYQRTLAHWSFTDGLPAKVHGPALNARTGEIAIEELHIAHQGLKLEAP
jgi:phage tail-like protein